MSQDYRFRADKNGTQFWSGTANHCSVPGCTSSVVTTTFPLTVTVQDSGGDPEPDLKVYAFDGSTYSGYNGTTNAAGRVTFTLPQGDYRFRADKDGAQFWSGASNHCSVPGCTAVSITTTTQAMGSPTGWLALAPSHTEWGAGIYRAPGLAAPVVQSGGTVTTTRIFTYSYDGLYRLTEATYSSGETYTYTFDAAGNRLSYDGPEGAFSYVYDAADRLTSVNGVAYTYDDNGNLLSDGTRTFAYDARNYLTQVVSGTLTTGYSYNGDGVRLSQDVNGETTRYVVDPAAGLPQILVEHQSTNSQSSSYLYGLGLIAQQDAGDWSYAHADGLGSVRQLTDPSGQVVLARHYDPYGQLVEASGTTPGRLGYTGEPYDAATGLIYLRARYYDPGTGRFLTRDPYPALASAPGTLNRYSYVGGNPVNPSA